MPVSANAKSAFAKTPDAFGVYVHWPFCAAKCPYCDFNSHVRHTPVDQKQFALAFCREIETIAARTPGREVASVFFGGGTPSLMEVATIKSILDCIAANWDMSDAAEITLEANPTSAEADRFQGYAKAGVNRLSLGVQALNDKDLKSLGRLHSVKEALGALAMARDIFPRNSFDLIYARPGQTLQEWQDELGQALALGISHISPYQLTIEAGTPFAALHAKGKLHCPPSALALDMFEATRTMCDAAGLASYEVSNHAKPGDESRHNLVYWRYGEYAGIGPGAHGRLKNTAGHWATEQWATETERHPETWRQMVEEKGSGIIADNLLTPDEAADEYLLMALRLSEGLNLARYEYIKGKSLPEMHYQPLIENGFLVLDNAGYLSTTNKGRPLLNTLIAKLAV